MIDRLQEKALPDDFALNGAIAGLVATIPMTAAMALIDVSLPRNQQSPQEPRIISDELMQRAGLDDIADKLGRSRITLLSHLGYGCACGTAGAALFGESLGKFAAAGLLFGLGVWTASYAGWLPAARVLPGPAHRPLGRNLLLILSHATWGVALHSVLRVLQGRGERDNAQLLGVEGR